MENLLHLSAWGIALILMALGLLGTFLPIIPGTALIVLGAGIYWLMLGADAGIGIVGFVILLLLTLAASCVELLSSAVGAKFFGASKWGAFGALTGGIIGFFFNIIGIIVGPIVGAILFELVFAKKEFKPAGKSGLGTVIGNAAGIAIKAGIAAVMIAWFFIDVLLIDRF